MQAIQVRFIGPTNTKGTRYKAFCDAGSLTLSADYSRNTQGNMANAAHALAVKLGWTKKYHGAMRAGSIPNGDMVFVFDYNDKLDSTLYCFAPDTE